MRVWQCFLSFGLWCISVPECWLLGNLRTQGAAAVGVPELCRERVTRRGKEGEEEGGRR